YYQVKEKDAGETPAPPCRSPLGRRDTVVVVSRNDNSFVREKKCIASRCCAHSLASASRAGKIFFFPLR
ncbi:hypothetical protein, partial [Geobacillus thermoleovorans]|uniref:hypothetical protein n=1 Tax=Geobacillus thermoleovorans TaxID=33941 RepID=UPI00272EA0BE